MKIGDTGDFGNPHYLYAILDTIPNSSMPSKLLLLVLSTLDTHSKVGDIHVSMAGFNGVFNKTGELTDLERVLYGL